MKKRTKRLISLLLALCILTMTPIMASAEEQAGLNEESPAVENPDGAELIAPEELKSVLPELTTSASLPASVGSSTAEDPVVSLSLEPLSKYHNTDSAALLWLGYDDHGQETYQGYFGYGFYPGSDWESAAWRVIAYDGQGVAGRNGAVTLLAADSSANSVFVKARDLDWYQNNYSLSLIAGCNPYHFVIADQNGSTYLMQRRLDSEPYRIFPPYTNGISGEAVDHTLWCLSAQEAYYLDPSLRQWDRDYWLRSPGVLPTMAAFVGQDGTVRHIGDDLREDNTKGVRKACHLDMEQVGLITAADNSGHQKFGPLDNSFNAKETGWKPAMRGGESRFFSWGKHGLHSGDTVLPVGYEENEVTLTFSHNSWAELGSYNTITAALTDSAGKLIFYGSAAETVEQNTYLLSSFPIPADLSAGEYTMTVYAQQWNDHYDSDFISRSMFEQEIKVVDFGVNITQQPQDLLIKGSDQSGNTLTVAAETVGQADEQRDFKYQWYACSDEDKSWSSPLEGEKWDNYTIPHGLLPGTYYYFCRVSYGNAHTDSRVAQVTISNALTVVNNDGSDEMPGMTYVDGVLKFTKPGSFTVSQTADFDQATPDRIVVEMEDKNDEFTLVLDGVNIQPPTATDGWVNTVEPGYGGLTPVTEIEYEAGFNALTLGPGKITVKVKGENRLHGGQGHDGAEVAPTPGGAGIGWQVGYATLAAWLVDGSLTIVGDGEGASLSLQGGAGGYDNTVGRLWGGGQGGLGFLGSMSIDGSKPLRLDIRGGDGGASYRVSGGDGGYGVFGVKPNRWSAPIGGGLSIIGIEEGGSCQAVITISGGPAGVGDVESGRQGADYDLSQAIGGVIKAPAGYVIRGGQSADELTALRESGTATDVISTAKYVCIAPAGVEPAQYAKVYSPQISMGLDGLEPEHKVWLGNIHTTIEGKTYHGPVPWLVLNDRGFLLSEHVLAKMTNVDEDVDPFMGTAHHQEMQKLYTGEGSSVFTSAERQVVAKTTARAVIDPMALISADSSRTVNIRSLYLYSLSEEEAGRLAQFTAGYITAPEAAVDWQLRDGARGAGFYYYNPDGSIMKPEWAPRYRPAEALGLRPAMNLAPEQVLFTSAAKGGKNAPGMDSRLTLIPDSVSREWKLTLLDSSRNFDIDQSRATVAPGGSVALTYTGAAVGANEHVSALLQDDSGQALYYGRLEQPERSSGTAWLDAPSFLPQGDYRVLVFSEQCNGDYQTDYASAFCELTLTIERAPSLLMGANGFDGFDSVEEYDYIWFGETEYTPETDGTDTPAPIKTPIKWRVLDNMYSNDDAYDHSFLLSEYLLSEDDVLFSDDGSLYWQNSVAQDWCEDFAGESFSLIEFAAIKETTGGEDEEALVNDELFFLSEYEARSWFYGFSSDDSRIAENLNGAKTVWWLRSPDSDPQNEGNMLMVAADGEIATTSVDGMTWAARPAFNLDHQAIFFTAAADNRSHIDFGPPPAYPADEEWKLTLKDGNDFSAGAALVSGDTGIYVGQGTELTVSHAALNSFTYAGYNNVTALLTDADGATLCYGSVNTDKSATSSTVAIPSGLPAGEYRLSLHAEDWNEAYYSDYASGEAFELSITVIRPSSVGFDGGTPAVTVPVFSSEGSVSVKATVSKGRADVTVTDEQLSQVISNSGAAGAVTLDASGLKNVDSVSIPAKVIKAVAEAAGADGLKVKLPTGAVTLDKTALSAVNSGADVVISVETVPNSGLSDAHRDILGRQADSALVVDVNVLVNNVKVTDFGGGTITVSIPYTPKAGEDTSKLTVWYLKDDGTIEPMNGRYNAATGCVEFSTTHLSEYAIVNFPFADVAEDSWYYADVAHAFNNGLFSGTGDDTFSPAVAMTRGMMVTVLYRMEGEPTVTAANPFDDVPAGQWYTDAVIWAAENKVVEGYGDGNFGPGDEITREQMATILCRYAAFKGYDVSAAADLTKFTDSGKISTWALAAMRWANAEGLINGIGDDLLDPLGSAQRCQVAAILHRFCEKIV